jgi:hypothetical protein
MLRARKNCQNVRFARYLKMCTLKGDWNTQQSVHMVAGFGKKLSCVIDNCEISR